METERIAVSINDAAKLAGLSRASIYRLVSAGKLTPRKSGHRTLFLMEELKRYLESLPAA